MSWISGIGIKEIGKEWVLILAGLEAFRFRA